MGGQGFPNGLQAGGRDIAAWTVAFYGRPRNALEHLVFSPGFRHCIAFAWIEVDRWLEVDPGMHRQRMRILTGPQYTRRLKALHRIGAHVVKVRPQGGSRRIPRVATCSGALAHVLGVSGALRPEGLYRALLRQSGGGSSDETTASNRDLHAPR
jgi:hypothetical protein